MCFLAVLCVIQNPPAVCKLSQPAVYCAVCSCVQLCISAVSQRAARWTFWTLQRTCTFLDQKLCQQTYLTSSWLLLIYSSCLRAALGSTIPASRCLDLSEQEIIVRAHQLLKSQLDPLPQSWFPEQITKLAAHGRALELRFEVQLIQNASPDPVRQRHASRTPCYCSLDSRLHSPFQARSASTLSWAQNIPGRETLSLVDAAIQWDLLAVFARIKSQTVHRSANKQARGNHLLLNSDARVKGCLENGEQQRLLPR